MMKKSDFTDAEKWSIIREQSAGKPMDSPEWRAASLGMTMEEYLTEVQSSGKPEQEYWKQKYTENFGGLLAVSAAGIAAGAALPALGGAGAAATAAPAATPATGASATAGAGIAWYYKALAVLSGLGALGIPFKGELQEFFGNIFRSNEFKLSILRDLYVTAPDDASASQARAELVKELGNQGIRDQQQQLYLADADTERGRKQEVIQATPPGFERQLGETPLQTGERAQQELLKEQEQKAAEQEALNRQVKSIPPNLQLSGTPEQQTQQALGNEALMELKRRQQAAQGIAPQQPSDFISLNQPFPQAPQLGQPALGGPIRTFELQHGGKDLETRRLEAEERQRKEDEARKKKRTTIYLRNKKRIEVES